ncbi:MAG: Alcohol dehydrogenase zinc-binding domain protein [Armatimonadetes bacterium]|nr:Alcohol dehydrogenase zinc-binding domain protein [Armatimonadota bacterium]
MKSRAAVLYGQKQPFVVEEVELDGPGPGEVLVEMAAGGICHSDWSVVQGIIPKQHPIILGHEGSARVLEIGEGVKLVKPGDPVILSWIPDCGHCYYCMSGKANLCDGRQPYADGTLGNGIMRFHKNGRRIRHYNGVSSFSQYAVVPERGCVAIDPRVPLDRAALIGCAVSTGVGAVIFTVKAEPGSTVAVFGAGGVGLNAIQGAAIISASRIIAVDVNPSKLEMAREFGATDVVNAAETDPVAAILELTRGIGVDYAFEAIGRADTIRQSFESLCKGGTAVVIGIAAKEELISIPPQNLVYGERKLVGSFYGSTRPRADFARFVDLYLSGRLKLDQLVTREWSIDQINEGFAAMNAGEVARGIINRYA